MATGVMAAFYLPPDVAAKLHQQVKDALGEYAVAPEEYHLTLVYAGDSQDINEDEEGFAGLVGTFASQNPTPIEGTIAGIGAFNPNEEQDTRCIYASVDAAGLPEFRQALIDYLQSENIASEQNHGFTPHITLAYIPADAPIPDLKIDTIPVVFDEITAAYGDYQMSHDLAAKANAAKYGAVLNRKNKDRLRAAFQTLKDVLKEAGIDLDIPDEDEPVKALKSVDRQVIEGGTIKALGTQDGRPIIGGYLISWNRGEERDLMGERFVKGVTDWTPLYNQPVVLYHHGLDPDVEYTDTGQIFELKEDENGVFAKAFLGLRMDDMQEWEAEQVKKYQEYITSVQRLVNKNVLRWSSGALPQSVIIDRDGTIKRWGIIEGSLTYSPAEPTQRTRVTTLKSLTPGSLKDLDGEEAQAQQPDGDNNAIETPTTIKTTEPIKDITLMNPQELAAAIIAQLREMGIDIPEDAANTLVESMTAQAAVPEEEVAKMTEDEKEEMKAEIVGKAVDAIAKQYRKQNAQVIADRFANAFANGIPASKATGGVRAPVTQPQGGGGQISVKSRRWGNLDAADMSYWLNLQRLRRHSKTWTPPADYDFWTEIAGKTLDEYEKGKLRFEEDVYDERNDLPRAIKSAYSIKANELNHSTQSSAGDEWVPDLWASQIWELMRLDNVVAPTIQVVEMPSNPFELPIESTDPTVFFVPETTAETELLLSGSGSVIPDSKMATGKVTLTAKKLALRVGYSMEVDEDSIIPFASQLRKQAQRAMLDAIDNVILNGDDTTGATGNINSDDGAPSATAKYLAFDGIRHLPLVTTTTLGVNGAGASPTLAMIRSARFKMRNAYALRPEDLRLVCDSSTYAKLLNLDEFITIDKAGPLATAQKGVIGFIDGIPVLPSNEMALTEADGKINTASPSATLFGQIVLYATYGWHLGYRRNVTVNVDYLSYYDSYQLTATVRLALAKRANDCAAVIYNLAV